MRPQAHQKRLRVFEILGAFGWVMAASSSSMASPSFALESPPGLLSPSFPLHSYTPPQPTECKGVWLLTIVDADTNEAVPNAMVEFRSLAAPKSNDKVRRSEATPGNKTPNRVPIRSKLHSPIYRNSDDQGQVRFNNQCPGRVEISVSKIEHRRHSSTIELKEGRTETRIELAPLHAHHGQRVILVHDESLSQTSPSEHLSGTELAENRGVGLGEAISEMTGVTTLGGTAGGMAKPVIRGQFGRRNLILFDGIAHAGQAWGIDHAPEIDPYAAGRITVIKGAATTRFGPNAIGGVVLVEPRPLPRLPSISGEASTIGNANPFGGGIALQLDHAPAKWRGFAWRIEGNVNRYRATLTPDYPLDNTGSLTWNTGGRAGYYAEQFDLEVGYRLMRMQAGICSCLRFSTTEEFAQAIQQSRPINADLFSPEFRIERPRQEVWHHLAIARSRIETADAGELHASYAIQFNDRSEFDVVRQNVVGPQIELELMTHSTELEWEHATQELGNGWRLVGSLGAQLEQQSNQFESSQTLIPDYQQWSTGPFVVERFVHERLELEIGGRYQGFHQSAQLSERDFLGQRAGGRLDEDACRTIDTGGARCKKIFHAPSGTIGLLSRPVPKVPALTLRTEFNSSGRIPAIDELYMNGAAPSFPVLGVGSSKLKIERTWGGTTTLQFDGNWFFAEGSAYANYIDNYIYFHPVPQEGQCAPLTCTTRGPKPVFAFDPTHAFFGGGELRLGLVAPRLPFEVSGSGSWVRAIDLKKNNALTWIPPNRYSLAGRYLWNDAPHSVHGYVEINGTVVDRQRHHDIQADFAPPPPAYVLLGASAGAEIPRANTLMRLHLRGENLLNQRYRDYTSLLRYFVDQPGWSLQLRFSIEFSGEVGAKASS